MIHCVYIGDDDGLYWIQQTDVVAGTWSPPSPLGGKTDQSPSVSVANPSSDFPDLVVFVRGLDGKLFFNIRSADQETELFSWGGWKSTNQSFPGSPACRAIKIGVPSYCLFRNKNNEIMGFVHGQKTKPTNGLSEGRPSIDGKRAFVQGLDGKLWFMDRVNNAWDGWKQTTVPVGKASACVMLGGNTNCFYVGDGGGAVAITFSNKAYKQ